MFEPYLLLGLPAAEGGEDLVVEVGAVLAAALLINMVVAGIAGSMMPMILKRLGIDPAVSSAVFVTTCTDVGGFFTFLGLATLLLRWKGM